MRVKYIGDEDYSYEGIRYGSTYKVARELDNYYVLLGDRKQRGINKEFCQVMPELNNQLLTGQAKRALEELKQWNGTRSGVKDDQGKDRWDLLPWEAVEQITKVMTFGANKYAPNGWKKVDDAHERYHAAYLRHYMADRRGEELDPESGLPHMAHAACCALFMLGLKLEKKDDSSN